MQNVGIDFFAAQDFLDNKGMYSMNSNVLMQNIQNQSYVNPLKILKAPVQQQEQMWYGYDPNVGRMPP